MNKGWKGFVSGLAAITALLALAVSSAPAAGDDVQSLRKEIENLKAGQDAMQKDLQEIKKLLQQRPAAAAEPAPARRSPVEEVDFEVPLGDEPAVLGDKSAKLALIEYSDYQCPFCRRHAAQTLPQIQKDYVDTGKLQYIFRDLPLDFHKSAGKAAEAARCAGEQGKYWEMHGKIFGNQRALAETNLTAHAEALGLDAAKFKQCLESGKFAGPVDQDKAGASKFGISGTPSFLLGWVDSENRKIKAVTLIRGAQQYDAFKGAIDKLLANAK